MGKQVKKPKIKAKYVQLKDQHGQPIEVWTYGGQYHATPVTMPTEVIIFGQKFRVAYHSRIYAEKKKASRLLGVVIYNHRLIMLDPGQTIPMMRESLYHEIAHMYIKVWQSKSESVANLTYQQIEDICDMFGEAIPDLVGNNTVSA